MNRNAAIGTHLCALREQAQIKQNELAKKLEWSAALLSRIENGERTLSDDELDMLLRGNWHLRSSASQRNLGTSLGKVTGAAARRSGRRSFMGGRAGRR